MSQGPLCPNLTQKVHKEVPQMANHNLPRPILLGGLSVNLNHLKMIMNDVNKILDKVSEHFRDYLVKKKMRQELPEINPSGADIKNVWEVTADTKGFYLSLVEHDDVVISHLFPPDDEEEDEYAHVDLPQPPEPEHEEHIATLKFPSYTSQKM